MKHTSMPYVQFSSVPGTIGSSGGHEGRFSSDSLPVFCCGRPWWAVLAQGGTSMTLFIQHRWSMSAPWHRRECSRSTTLFSSKWSHERLNCDVMPLSSVRASLSTWARLACRSAMPAGSCSAWSTASSPTVRCPPTGPSIAVMTLTASSSARLASATPCRVPSWLTWSPELSVRQGGSGCGAIRLWAFGCRSIHREFSGPSDVELRCMVAGRERQLTRQELEFVYVVYVQAMQGRVSQHRFRLNFTPQGYFPCTVWPSMCFLSDITSDQMYRSKKFKILQKKSFFRISRH